jgi:hypothetical protein
MRLEVSRDATEEEKQSSSLEALEQSGAQALKVPKYALIHPANSFQLNISQPCVVVHISWNLEPIADFRISAGF